MYRSFAYHTVNVRLPVTITQIVDLLARSFDELLVRHGIQYREDLKTILKNCSNLKYELQTNKRFIPLTDKCTLL